MEDHVARLNNTLKRNRHICKSYKPFIRSSISIYMAYSQFARDPFISTAYRKSFLLRAELADEALVSLENTLLERCGISLVDTT